MSRTLNGFFLNWEMGRGGIRLVMGASFGGRSHESSCQDDTSAVCRPMGRAGGAGGRVAQTAAPLACTSLQQRLQSDDDGVRDHIETIRDKAAVGNAMPIPVGGVGLVVGLEGTGGDCPPSSYRSILENELRKENIHSIRELLPSPNNAMVFVSGLIPRAPARTRPSIWRCCCRTTAERPVARRLSA